MSILVISFDAISDKVFESMAEDSKNYPNVARFFPEAYYQRGIKTVFMSNTYPVHTTVSTGKLPKKHGVISNLLPPNKSGKRHWAQMAKCIKAKTIWEAAREKKLSTAAMIWPVTCGAKIDYHMPEVHVEKGQNAIFRGLLYGSVFFQLSGFFKYSEKLKNAFKGIADGTGLPPLDNFITAVTCDMLKSKKPDLALVHLIAYDTLFHFAGSKGKEIDIAKKTMDTNLGLILDSWAGDTVIIFSDHSQFDVNENVNLATIYGDAVFEQTGGSAFFIREVAGLEEQSWFERYLTTEEMQESGYADKPVLGIAAKPGYAFSESCYRGNHGYPADYENYNVFYAVKGKNFIPGHEKKQLKKHITDITAIIVSELGLDMDIDLS